MSGSDGIPFLEVSGLTKSFGQNTVLDDVSLSIPPGEFHGLVGENGAGKSTLVNLITGMYRPDSGSVKVEGSEFRRFTPEEATRAGIRVVHQELSLSPHLSISQNMFLGKEPVNRIRTLNTRYMREATSEHLETVGLGDLSPDTPVRELPLAERQLVEFLKAMYEEPRLLVLDEATSALGPDRVEMMFKLLDDLRQRGMAVIFVSHRLPEILSLCEKATVLKDGVKVATCSTADVDEDRLVSLMAGRELADLFPEKPSASDLADRPEGLVVEGLQARGVHDVSFSLRQGEILGIGGLQGQGQQELLEVLFGLRAMQRGTIKVRGTEARLRNPRHAMSMGIAYLPEDRKEEGLFLGHGVRFNLSFAALKSVCDPIGTVKRRPERSMVADAIRKLKIKSANMDQSVGFLSGGNQQRVVLAKWLERDPEIILLNDPTRGIDVGTMQEFYELLRSLAGRGVAVVIVSSSAIELIGLCDRVLVLYEGRPNGFLEDADLTEENLVRASVVEQ